MLRPPSISSTGKITGWRRRNGKKVERRGTIGIARGRSSTRKPGHLDVDVVVVVVVADVPWLWECW
jgi:hypothetical protein